MDDLTLMQESHQTRVIDIAKSTSLAKVFKEQRRAAQTRCFLSVNFSRVLFFAFAEWSNTKFCKDFGVSFVLERKDTVDR